MKQVMCNVTLYKIDFFYIIMKQVMCNVTLYATTSR